MKNIPFPQANNMDLIFNVLNDIGNDGLTRMDVSSKYNIKDRQGAYYLDALLYLNFVEKINTIYFLNNIGVKIRLSPKDEMRSVFAKEVIRHHFIGKLYYECKNMNKKEKQVYISNCIFNEYKMSSNTSKRRASSVVSWFDWIENNI